MITPNVFQDCVQSVAFERRQFQRLKRAVQIELRVHGTQVPVRTETADISAGGCYIEMAVTLEVGEPLDLVLWLGHKKIGIPGKVVTRHPQFGNGIEFGRMPEESLRKLQNYIESEQMQPTDCEIPTLVEGFIA